MQGLLREVLNSRDVGRALETAEREPVPFFVQLAAESGRTQGAAVNLAGLGGPPPSPMWVPPPPPMPTLAEGGETRLLDAYLETAGPAVMSSPVCCPFCRPL